MYTLTAAPAPTAAFIAVPNTGRRPYSVQFTDTSTPAPPATGAPSSWPWDFGDGSGLVHAQNATHQYSTVGNFTATLTVANAAGSTFVTHPIR